MQRNIFIFFAKKYKRNNYPSIWGNSSFLFAYFVRTNVRCTQSVTVVCILYANVNANAFFYMNSVETIYRIYKITRIKLRVKYRVFPNRKWCWKMIQKKMSNFYNESSFPNRAAPQLFTHTHKYSMFAIFVSTE